MTTTAYVTQRDQHIEISRKIRAVMFQVQQAQEMIRDFVSDDEDLANEFQLTSDLLRVAESACGYAQDTAHPATNPVYYRNAKAAVVNIANQIH